MCFTRPLLAAMLATAGAPAVRADIVLGDPIDHSNYTILDQASGALSFEPLPADNSGGGAGEGGTRGTTPQVFYGSGINPFGPLRGFISANNGAGIRDDYRGNRPGEVDLSLFRLRFVGGAVAPASGGDGGTTSFFDFYTSGGSFKGGFGVDLGQYGDFLYAVQPTIMENILVDNAGFLQISGSVESHGRPGTTVRWWYTDATDIGFNQGGLPADGTPAGTIYTFELTEGAIPAPSAVALLGLAGIAAACRRRC